MKKKSLTVNNDLTIVYYDNELFDKPVVIFVHGWGADKDNLKIIYQSFINKYRVLSVDLPGFGESSRPDFTAGSIDYAEFLNEFIKVLELKDITYIGHSFGGKIGILLCSEKNSPIKNLVLINSAGLKSKRKINWYIKVYSYKMMKFFYKNIIKDNNKIEKIKNKYGSDDYKNSRCMRDILVKVVNEDFTDRLDKIKCPVFLYWGEKDDATPMWMAKKMNKLIKDSALYVVKKGDHYCFLQDLTIVKIIQSLVNTA